MIFQAYFLVARARKQAPKTKRAGRKLNESPFFVSAKRRGGTGIAGLKRRLMVLGLIGAVVLASGSLLKAFAMALLGLLLGLVGADVNSGIPRFSFDIPELMDGIGFVAIVMGIFGYGEIISNLGQSEKG